MNSRSVYESVHGRVSKWYNVVLTCGETGCDRPDHMDTVFAFTQEGKKSKSADHFARMRNQRGLPASGAPGDLHPSVTGKHPPIFL